MPEDLPAYTPDPKSFETEESAVQFMAKKVRTFLRDEVDKNHLLLGKREFTWEDIYEGLEDALGDFNVTQPSTNYNMKTVPSVIRRLMYLRAAVYCFRSAANQQARNQMQYSDQGFSVSESDKAQVYLEMAARLLQDYEEKKMKIKAELNAAATWGGIYSEPLFSPSGLDYTEDYI